MGLSSPRLAQDKVKIPVPCSPWGHHIVHSFIAATRELAAKRRLQVEIDLGITAVSFALAYLALRRVLVLPTVVDLIVVSVGVFGVLKIVVGLRMRGETRN